MNSLPQDILRVKREFASHAKELQKPTKTSYRIAHGRTWYGVRCVADFTIEVAADYPTHYILVFRGKRGGDSVLTVSKKIFHTPQRLAIALNAVNGCDAVWPRMSGHLYRAIVALNGLNGGAA